MNILEGRSLNSTGMRGYMLIVFGLFGLGYLVSSKQGGGLSLIIGLPIIDFTVTLGARGHVLV